MAVKLKGQHSFDAPRDVVWQALNDPEILARTLPGCEKLEEVEPNHYKGELNMRVGPVQGKFQGDVQLADIQAPESYRLEIKGSGPAGFVEGKGSVRLHEADTGSGKTTHLDYDLDAQIGGRIAGVGQRLLDSSARVITRQTLEGLGRQIEALNAALSGPGGRPGQAASTAAAAGATSGPTGASIPTGEARAGAGSATDSHEGTAAQAGTAAGAADAGARAKSTPAYEPPPAPTQAEFAARVARDLFDELVPRKYQPVVLGASAALVVLLIAVVLRPRDR